MYIATVRSPDYDKAIPGIIQYAYGDPIQIVPNQKLQEYISRLGMMLVPEYQKSMSANEPTKIKFKFYLVHSFVYMPKSHFISVDGRLPKGLRESDRDRYNSPKPHALVKTVIAMPTGVTLIPDVALIHVNNQAQLAALLFYAITSILQKQAYFGSPFTLPMSDSDVWGNYYSSRDENEQLLRNGIRQMYLAGYDIREAPFAWAVAQGKPATNPVIDSKNPGEEIPWYAAYAFNYISQYYKDVDYSKLKRGDAEYQQFLRELHKADPSLAQARNSH